VLDDRRVEIEVLLLVEALEPVADADDLQP